MRSYSGLMCRFLESPSDPKLKVCRFCCLEVRSNYPPHKINSPCKNNQEHDAICADGLLEVEPPTIMQRLANFTVAAISHVANGMPTCDQQEIDARLAICRQCRFFKESDTNKELGVCCHKDCGCNAGRDVRFLNKLAWKDQKCPLDKW